MQGGRERRPCYDRGVRKPWVAVVALLAFTGPIVSSFTTSADHDCTDHSCRCGKRPPSRANPTQPCHGGEGEDERGCEMRSRCNHDSPVLVTARACIMPRALTAAIPVTAELVAPPPAPAPRAGVLRIDSPPPKSI